MSSSRHSGFLCLFHERFRCVWLLGWQGSVFCVSREDRLLKPLALECLAHPSGIVAKGDGSVVYVSETMANRVLRLVRRSNDVYHCRYLLARAFLVSYGLWGMLWIQWPSVCWGPVQSNLVYHSDVFARPCALLLSSAPRLGLTCLFQALRRWD